MSSFFGQVSSLSLNRKFDFSQSPDLNGYLLVFATILNNFLLKKKIIITFVIKIRYNNDLVLKNKSPLYQNKNCDFVKTKTLFSKNRDKMTNLAAEWLMIS